MRRAARVAAALLVLVVGAPGWGVAEEDRLTAPYQDATVENECGLNVNGRCSGSPTTVADAATGMMSVGGGAAAWPGLGAGVTLFFEGSAAILAEHDNVSGVESATYVFALSVAATRSTAGDLDAEIRVRARQMGARCAPASMSVLPEAGGAGIHRSLSLSVACDDLSAGPVELRADLIGDGRVYATLAAPFAQPGALQLTARLAAIDVVTG